MKKLMLMTLVAAGATTLLAGEFKAGFARTDITPPLGVYMPGYYQARHAKETARLMNETQPSLIFTGTIHPDPGCPLYEEMREGAFVENTIGEYLEEEELFLQDLELERCFLFGLHPSNVVRMQGWLPEDKDRLLEAVRKTRGDMKRILDKRPIRAGEGGIIGV